MSNKIKAKGLSIQENKPAKAQRNDPQFEVHLKLMVPANDRQLRDLLDGPRWKNLVRTVLHTLMDWRDYSEGAESKAYDSAVKYLRGEMADNGLTLVIPELAEEQDRRARIFWSKRIAEKNKKPDAAAQFEPTTVEKLISNGETDGSKAALDFALNYGFQHGGWCRGGKPSESAPLDERFLMSELEGATMNDVAERNIVESDATVVITEGLELRSLARIARLAKKNRKPFEQISSLAIGDSATGLFRQFLREHRPRVLNVLALPSSEEPGAADFVRELLTKALLPMHSIID